MPQEAEIAVEVATNLVSPAAAQAAFQFGEAAPLPNLPVRPERFGSRTRRPSAPRPEALPLEDLLEGPDSEDDSEGEVEAAPAPREDRAARTDAASRDTAPPKRARSRSESSVSTAPPSPKIDPPELFRALGVDDTGLAALAALGFAQPTPIQEQSITALLNGEDVVGLAQTGTGKTLAFGLPLAAAVDPSNPGLQALVLVPTRELAKQVSETLAQLALFYHFSVVTLTGGTRVAGDITRLRDGAQVMVGTPGPRYRPPQTRQSRPPVHQIRSPRRG